MSYTRRPMSGFTSGPRGSRVSKNALGDIQNAASLPSCSNVPAGTPCTLSDGSIVFGAGLPPCSSAAAGQPCNASSGGGALSFLAYGLLAWFGYKALFK